MKRKYVIVLIAAFLIIIYLIFRMFIAAEKVETVKVTRGKLVTLVYATGKVTADETAVLRSEAGGNVVKLNVKEGSRAAKGTVLMQTDTKDVQLAINQAENDIEAAKVDLADKLTNLNRLSNLLKGNAVTQKEYDAAKRDYDIAKISLDRRMIMLNKEKENLAKHSVTAPFDCLVYSRTVNLGDYLPVNAECFKVFAPGSVLVEAEVDEQDLSKVAMNGRCITAFDAYPNQRYEGLVFRIVPKTDEATKTSKIYIKLDSLPQNLNIGMTATVNIMAGEKHGVLILPRTAITTKNNKNYVLKVAEGRLREAEITTGLTEGNYVEVTAGASEGDVVIRETKTQYKDGMRVKP